MHRHHLSGGAVFHWQQHTYRILRLLPEGKANLEDTLSGAVMIVEISVLVQALFHAELSFADAEKRSPLETQVTPAAKALPLADYPESLVAIARYRYAVIRPVLEMPSRTYPAVHDYCQALKAANDAAQPHTLRNAVSVSAVYRWMRDYTRRGNDLRALIPSVHERGGKNRSRLRSEVENLTEIVLRDKCGIQEQTTIDDARYELAVRIAEENQVRAAQEQLSMPSRATLARRMAAAAQGEPPAKGERTDRQYQQTPYPRLPLERVEIDHTRSDLVVIDDQDNLPLGRLTLTYCLDLATRYPLGFYLGFEPPSYLTVMECLHHAICPKGDMVAQYGTEHAWIAYGIPTTLVIDNGKEFIGRDLEDACLLLGTVLQYSPVQTPQFKAGIERMFGSLNTMFFHGLPGTTFSNPDERGAYDSLEQACVYFSEVDKMLHIFLLDIYAERFHHGLNGIPARAWETRIQQGFAPALPPDAAELSILLGRTTTRVIQHYGIEFLSLRYNGDDLFPLRTRLKGQAAKIKYHPADLSCVYVYDPFEQQYLRVPALDQEYTQGLSLWKHRVIRQAVLEEQDQVDIVALGKAKRKIQQIVEEGRTRKRQAARSRAARWETAGKPSRQVAAGQANPPKLESSPSSEAKPSSLSMEVAPNEEADGWEVGSMVWNPPNVPPVVKKGKVAHE